MKLALVIPGFQANPQDWCIPAFTNLARELAKRVELHVFALRYPGEKRNYRVGQVYVHAIGGGAFAGRRFVGASLLKLWKEALDTIAREHVKVKFGAVMGVWATESGWLATVASKRLGLPSLVHLAGGELIWLPDIRYGNGGRGLARMLVQRCLKNADLLTVPSGPMESALRKYVGIEQDKKRAWALGVDTEMFKPCAPDQRQAQSSIDPLTFTFVTVGSLIPVKGHHWLIRGMKMLIEVAPDVPFRLNIIGDGPLRSELQALVQSYELRGYVNFLGDVRHDQLPRHLQMADCFLLGSRHEAQCMAALEAMACGLPWIGPPVGVLADCAVSSQTSGILVKDMSEQELVHAMAAMLRVTPEQRTTWSTEARRRVVNHYELVTQTSKLVNILAELTM